MLTLRKLYQKLNKVSDIIIKILQVFIAAMVIASILTVLLQIFNRYILCKISDFSIHFTDELSRYLMIWSAYFSIAMCLREGAMARVDLVYMHLGKKSRFWLYIATCVMTYIFYVIVIRYGIHYAHVMRSFKTSMLKWPGNIVYSAPLFGTILMMFESTVELIGVISGELEPFEAGKKRTILWHEEAKKEGNADE